MKQFADSDFDVFKYRLPHTTPEIYVRQAIDILMAIEQLGVRYLPYFLSSDIVLTLSGVRAYDTYITFEGLKNSDIKLCQNILDRHAVTLTSESTEYDQSNNFFMINKIAFQDIPHHYKLPDWIPLAPPFTMERYIVWKYMMELSLSISLQKGELPTIWSYDPAAVHHILFGIVLGYPGEGIACACWMNALGEKEMPNSRSAKIAYVDAYNSAYPNYYYSDHIENNQNIIAHQALWSDILTGVYQSRWHEKIKKNPEFIKAARKVDDLKSTYDSE